MRWSLLVLCAGCFGDKTTLFPPGLDPVDPVNQAPLPMAENGDPYPEQLMVASGKADGYYWSDARGYIHAPITRVWEALRKPEVCVDRRKIDHWTVTMNVEDYPVSFVIHSEVDDIVTVRFDVTWREAATMGPADAPQVVSVRYQKTWGSTIINLLAGSIQLISIDPETTEIDLIEHLDALTADSGPATSFQQDLFASVVAFVHDQPLPTYP